MLRRARLLIVAGASVIMLTVGAVAISSSSSFSGEDAPNTSPPTTFEQDWPDAGNTGIAKCGPLTRVDNENEINLDEGGVLENTELLNPVVLQVRGPGVTIRCVKFTGGTGYFGVDNTHYGPTGNTDSVLIDQVEIDCKDGGQLTGLLVHSATVSRVNIGHCEDGVKIGGNDVVVRDSYCHDLTNIAIAHSDCIQSYGDNQGLLVQHNSLWSRDTSDVLMGQEGGDSAGVVIRNNQFMSVGDPPPAFLLYVSGTNTIVANNQFSRRFSFGACTVTTKHPVTWTANTWEDDGSPIEIADCR